MGITEKKVIDDYWTISRLDQTPGIRELISREHFNQIYRMISFRK